MKDSKQPNKYFQPHGTSAMNRHRKSKKTYKENCNIIDAIFEEDYSRAKELISESILKRVDKPVKSGMEKGGEEMTDHIFGD